MKASWDVFYTDFAVHGAYRTVLNGLLTTIEIAVFGLIIGIFIGTVIAVIKVLPQYNKFNKIIGIICDVYVGFFRGTPMVVQLLLGYFVLMPALGIRADNVAVAIVIFGLNSGAYVSEIMRSGINSVDGGQLEAARAVGLSYGKSMLRVIIPQAIKNIMPTLGNEFIVLIKETSVVSFIAVVDITKALRSIADSNYEYIIPYLMLALVYLILVFLITQLIKFLERRLSKSDRRN